MFLVEREACPLNKAPTASTTVTLALGDALAVCLLKKRGFSYEDFLVFHPSGALGKGILYKVSDLMLKDEKLPVVDENLSFIEAVKLISDKKLGCAYILNQDKTLILNSPKALRDFNEKLYINKFPNLAPKNIVSANKNIIKEFLFSEEEIIIKPLNRCFSSGVFYLNKEDKNINAIIDTATNNGKTQVMVQKFLKGIMKGDKRLIFIGGEIFEYAVRKVAIK